MFTGLVEDVGTVTRVRPEGNGLELLVRTQLGEISVGASVAVDGVCLTASSLQPGAFCATAARETLERTSLRGISAGRKVHLERALKVGDRLGGHWVQGHVDGIGRVTRAVRDRESLVLWIELPTELTKYVAAKGSIAVDGVSLTVNELDGARFRVNLVPHTLEVTRMGSLAAGDPVNVEVDILAKYIERLLKPTDGVDWQAIAEKGIP